MRIQFEKSRADYPVSPDCPVWHPKGEPPIPLVRMETQHIKNCMGFLLRIGMPEMASCKIYHYLAQNSSGTAAARLLTDSVRRLKYMDLWYSRFMKELERRITDGEEVGTYPTRIPEESSGSKIWRDSLSSGLNRFRHLLSAPKEGARNQ